MRFMREFLHLNGASEIDAQPRVVGCETLKQAKRTRALSGRTKKRSLDQHYAPRGAGFIQQKGQDHKSI
jgi:hypothetical protein